ncbi:hypothetical protein [Halobellus rubicundus]|uniref:DUF2178 domain-containing protein n=1 Tax=Halobellus rubicundus TaxID=2996466 RepID=A0ABD5M7M9_9EURY
MGLARGVRQVYRGYGIAAVVWAGWSLVWIATDIRMDPATIGYGWLTIAAVGFVLGVTMTGMRVHGDFQLFRVAENRRHIRRFNDHSLSGAPLNLYAGLLAVWAVLTVAWVTGAITAVGTALIGYGWLAIALYGGVLTLGLAVEHKQQLLDAVDDVAPIATN